MQLEALPQKANARDKTCPGVGVAKQNIERSTEYWIRAKKIPILSCQTPGVLYEKSKILINMEAMAYHYNSIWDENRLPF